VDRLPDLETPFRTGDDVRHTHYVTHYPIGYDCGHTERAAPRTQAGGGWCHHERAVQGGHLGNPRWLRQAGR
jgi:hypothetical protein